MIFPIPSHDARKNGIQSRTKKRGGVDPDELCRLLNNHIENQALKAEQRRAAKALKAAAGPYVPREAASAHQKTTSPDAMRQFHKLSQPVYKQHFEVLRLDIPGSPLKDLQRTQLWDPAVVDRNIVRNRNQWEWDQRMEKAAEVDLEREINRPPQRTFPELACLVKEKSWGEQPMSGRDMFWENSPLQRSKEKLKTAFEGRNDWAQKEDTESGDKQAKLEKIVSPSWMKDSNWIMRRKEKFVVVEEEAVEVGDCGSPPPMGSIRGRGRGFLARFNRH
jgi:hypothetical protein